MYIYIDSLQLMIPWMATHTYDHDMNGKPSYLSMLCTCVWANVMSGPLVFVFVSLLQCCMKYCILLSGLYFTF